MNEQRIDAIDFADLSGLLSRVRERFAVAEEAKPKLDMLGFDACDLATVEMACQLHPFASYLLGSQRSADAVHAASVAVLQNRRARGQSTHPFYWAAFVAVGDWR